MRTRLTVIALAATTLLAGCTSSGGGSAPTRGAGSSSTSHSPTAVATTGNLTAACRRLVDIANALTKAEADLYTSGSDASLRDLQAQLTSLNDGVPANVKAAVDELASSFATAQQLLAHPSDQAKAELAKLQPKISADAQTLSTYVVKQCPAR